MKILIIPHCSSDYLQDSVYLGMKDLFGADVECTYDCSYLYKGTSINKLNYWGYGFTYTNILDPSINSIAVDVLSKIQNHYYDLIIYSFISRNSSMIDDVMKTTNGKNVILINGEDENHRYEYYNDKIIYFKRELVKPIYKNILPISYAIHRSKLLNDEPVKTQEISDSIPSLDNCTPISSSKYIFENEQDYYRNYQISKYGITKKKGGWDSMRHYEILANKCVPLFQDIDKCPEYTLTKFPKKLLSEIINTYPNISDNLYEQYNQELFNYTSQYLTTDELAKYILTVSID